MMASISKLTVDGPMDPAYATASNAESILGVTGFFMAFTVVVMAARLYVRMKMLRNVGPDDWIMLGSVVCGIGVFICFVGETHHGMGMHYKTISVSAYTKLLHWQFFHSIIVTVGISLIKISVAFFLYRLTPSVGMKRFLIGMVVFLIAFTFSSAGTLIFNCNPVAGSWDRSIKNSKCFSNTVFSDIGIFNSSINIATDILFAALPVPMVWKLQVNMRMKLTLITILGLGFFACTASIVKLSIQVHFFNNPDYTWKDSYYIWNSIEQYIGILAASLPSLRPLFTAFLESTSNALSSSGLRSRPQAGRSRYYAHESGMRLDSISHDNRADGAYAVQVTGNRTRSAKDGDSLGDLGQRSGSEETILPVTNKNGIVRTTEVSIS